MGRKIDFFIPCVVQPGALAGQASDVDEFVFARSTQKLVAAELTDEELQELGFRQHSVNAPSAPVKAVEQTAEVAETTSRMVDATIDVIADQIRNVDLEAEMLSLRKRALKRRLRILERLSKSLGSCDEDRKAA